MSQSPRQLAIADPAPMPRAMTEVIAILLMVIVMIILLLEVSVDCVGRQKKSEKNSPLLVSSGLIDRPATSSLTQRTQDKIVP